MSVYRFIVHFHALGHAKGLHIPYVNEPIIAHLKLQKIRPFTRRILRYVQHYQLHTSLPNINVGHCKCLCAIFFKCHMNVG